MIRSIKIVNPAKAPLKWVAEVPALAKSQKFEFKPGLNILWGKNGSGKSTLIKLLARLTHCEQGGSTQITFDSLRELFATRFDNIDEDLQAILASLEFDHDGQCVRYFDPSAAVGLKHGAFDDDFFTMGVMNTMFKGSSGQTTMFRFDKILKELIEGKVPEIKHKIQRVDYETSRNKELAAAEAFLKGAGECGPVTVLLDEPERSYDLTHQVAIWRFLRGAAKKVQIIAASHSFFALQLPEANYITMDDPKYLEDSSGCLKLLNTTWTAEAPLDIAALNKPPAKKKP